jgi:hypothetical protein
MIFADLNMLSDQAMPKPQLLIATKPQSGVVIMPMLISLARAAAISPFVSAYAPNVKPRDFHAVAGDLDGAWHLVDPTGMARADEIVRIGVGLTQQRSFLSSFGPMTLCA